MAFTDCSIDERIATTNNVLEEIKLIQKDFENDIHKIEEDDVGKILGRYRAVYPKFEFTVKRKIAHSLMRYDHDSVLSIMFDSEQSPRGRYSRDSYVFVHLKQSI